MKLFTPSLGAARALALLCVLCFASVAIYGQTGIGTIAADADKALHVVATPSQDPIRLQGLRIGSTEEDVIVTDANGVLRYRPIADLTVSGEWRDSIIAGQALIYAFQSTGNGEPVVLTDAGNFGIGTATPGYRLDVNGTARIATLPGGDVDGTGAADDYIVTADQATGQLKAVDAADLLRNNEWVDHSSGAYVLARRARAAGNDVVVRDNGFLGIGTTNPLANLHIDGASDASSTGAGGALRLSSGANRLLLDDNEIAAFTGTSPATLHFQADGGDVSIGQNGTTTRVTINNLPTGDVDGSGTDDQIVTANANGDLRQVPGSALRDNLGDHIARENVQLNDFYLSNDGGDEGIRVANNGRVGIGIAAPTRLLDVNGLTRIRDLPAGLINNDPINSDRIVTSDAFGNLRKVRPDQLFSEGEWSNHSSNQYIFARRAKQDAPVHDVVVTTEGQLGLGRTNPQAMVHLDGGGMRIDGQTFGIAFNGENPFQADPIRDGARMYQEAGSFGGWSDAFVIEKTDFNNGAVDGGIAFASRQSGNSRVINMVIRGNGRVGIGDNLVNPSERFHVAGNGLFQTGGTGSSADGGILKLVDDRTLPTGYTRGVQVADQNEYTYFGLDNRALNRHDGMLMWGNGAEQDFHFVNHDSGVDREVMMLDGNRLSVGIGTVPEQNSAIKLDVNGRVRVRDLDPQASFDEGNDLIVIADAQGHLQTVSSIDFKQTFEDLDWTIDGNDIYNANTRAVGIGVSGGFGGSYKLEIGGDTRVRDANRLYFRDAETYIYSSNSQDLDIQARDQTTFRKYGTALGAHPLVVDHNGRSVGIGVNAPDNTYALEVEGNTRLRNTSELRFGADNDNMLYANSNSDFRLTAQELFSVRSRGDGVGVLAVRTDQRRVGISINNPAVGFDVDTRVRLRDLPNGNEDTDFFVTANNTGDLRRVQLTEFEGPWDNAIGTPGRTFLRQADDNVGIGVSNPTSKLHIFEAVGQNRTAARGTITLEHGDAGGQSSIVFKSRVNNNSDYAYINYQDDNPELTSGSNEQSLLEIGVQNDGSDFFRDDIALMPGGKLGVAIRVPSAMLDVNGDVRVRALPNSTVDPFAVTADNDGNLSRQPISSIRDNLGNHQMTQDLATNGDAISFNGTDAGIKLTPQNSTMLSNRLQIGNIVPSWIDDPLSGTNAGFAGNDGAIFAPVYTGSETSDLRLYILDNPNDEFSIWGDPCGTGDCGSMAASSRVARFRADGQITLPDLATGGGPDQVVVANAQGVLSLGGVPGGGASTGGDNLGNHVATQDIILGPHQIRGQNGFRFDGGAGQINFPNGGAMFWGSVYGTAISGDVDANSDGNSRDLRFESDDDIYFDVDDDFYVKSDGDVAFAIDNGYRFSAGTDNNDDDFRFYVNSNSNNVMNTRAGSNGNEALRIQNDSRIRVPNLAGAGSRIVTADANGILGFMNGSSTGLWTRNGGANDTYLANQGDEVGIGTTNPDAELHIVGDQSDSAGPVELRINNNNGGGQSAISFTEGSSTNSGMRFVYDGSDNDLRLEQGDGRQYMTYERGRGNVGIGAQNPDVMLHVMRRTGDPTTGGVTAGSSAEAGYNNPARIRLQNQANNGSSGLEFVEGAGGPGNNSAMSLRYNSAADGSRDGLEIIRGATENATAQVHLRVERNTGEVTLRDLSTGGVDEMVVADANGVLDTRPFDAALWQQDAADSELFLDPAVAAFRLGIGTDAPTAKLHVAGDARITTLGTGADTDFFVTSDAAGVLRRRPASVFQNYWERDATGNGVNPYTYTAATDDYVGVGTAAPDAKLDINGDLRIRSVTAGAAGVDAVLVLDAATNEVKQIPASTFDDFWDRNTSGAQDYVNLSNATDFVGIGTVGAPTAKLHVNGGVRLESLSNPGGEMVVADASGNLSTQALPAQSWDIDFPNNYTFLSNSSHNVGIGTSAPNAKLHIAGTGTLRIDGINSTTGGNTDRIVVADAEGDLLTVPVSTFESFWAYEAGNHELYPKDLENSVGIGTSDPRSDLHISRAGGSSGLSSPIEFQIQNRTNGGTAAIRFRDNGNTGAIADNYNSMSLRWVGNTNMLEIANGSDSAFFRMRRQNGRLLLGQRLATGLIPQHQLHVDGNIGLFNGHGIRFDEPNSYLNDVGVGDLALRADDVLNLLADGIMRVNSGAAFEQIAGGDMTVDGGGDYTLTANGDLLLDAAAAATIEASGTSNVTLRTSNNDRLIVHDNGRIEVLASGATDDLHVNGRTRSNELRLETGAATGYVLQSLDNNGNANWVDPSTIFTGGNPSWERTGTSVALANAGDNVAIGAIPIGGVQLRVGGLTRLNLGNGSSDTRIVTANLAGDLSTRPLTSVGTDNQDLSLTANSLSLTNDATPVDLSGYLDNTDAQTLSWNQTTQQISITNGSPVTLTGIGGASPWNKTGDVVSVASTNRVGIGTTTVPTSETLRVQGNAAITSSLQVGNALTVSGPISVGTTAPNRLSFVSGNLGIGTPGAGAAKLHVVGNGTANPVRFEQLIHTATTTGLEALVVDVNGNVRKANINMAGVITSDRRLKKDIVPFEGVLDRFDELNSVTYRYRHDVADYTRTLDTAVHYGIIAQDVAKVFPHAVKEIDGYLHVDTDELVGILLSAAKDLKSSNDNLEEQVFHMMNDKADLERKVDALTAETAELQTNMATVLKYVASQSQVQAGGK